MLYEAEEGEHPTIGAASSTASKIIIQRTSLRFIQLSFGGKESH